MNNHHARPLFGTAAVWLLALAGSASAQTLPPEVQVGTREIKDYEFDSARDGAYCATCNGGAGNSRLAYIGTDHNVWVGQVDFGNGDLKPRTGKGTLVDTNAVTPNEIGKGGPVGNGPEWMDSKLGSQLVYSRWTDGKPHTNPNIQLGFARMDGPSSWIAGPIEGSAGRLLPIGSSNPNQPNPLIHYQTFPIGTEPAKLYWRGVYPGAVEQDMLVAGDDRAEITRRWVPGTRDIILTAPTSAITLDATPSEDWRQVFLYHTDDGTVEQLTFDEGDKYSASMWRAPEFGNEQVFAAVVGGKRLDIYRSLPMGSGGNAWTVAKSITAPIETPYISSPEQFVHKGTSWIVFSLSANPDQRDFTEPSLVAMSGIAPGVDNLRALTSATDPTRVRRDPEYFITANGPYIYYNRYLLQTDARPPVNEGVFRVDTQLGPPAKSAR